MTEAEHYRCRRIYLKQCDDSSHQANAACEALANIEGILLAAPHSDHSVHIIYTLDKLSFEIIVDLLGELEFEIDDSLLMSLRSTIFGYLEDNARDNMHIDETELHQEDGDQTEIPHPDNNHYWEDYH